MKSIAIKFYGGASSVDLSADGLKVFVYHWKSRSRGELKDDEEFVPADTLDQANSIFFTMNDRDILYAGGVEILDVAVFGASLVNGKLRVDLAAMNQNRWSGESEILERIIW